MVLIESFLLGLILFGIDIFVLLFIAKKIVKKEEGKKDINKYLKFFVLKFLVLFVVLAVVIKYLKPDILLFVIGAFCALIITGFLLFLLNKNN